LDSKGDRIQFWKTSNPFQRKNCTALATRWPPYIFFHYYNENMEEIREKEIFNKIAYDSSPFFFYK
jgi:hypothetical protein